jgi:type I restriction enzyme R subunit
VAENSLNQQNIESQIRQQLLPRVFELVGLEHAKGIVEQVVQITRLGLRPS